jgi:hypothetical protein
VAAIVIRDDFVKPRANIFDARDFQEKSREFEHFGLELPRPFQIFRLLLEDVCKMVRDHRRARARRDHDVFGAAKDIEKMARDFPRFLAITAVEGRLPTAGLLLRKIDWKPQALQHLYHSHPGFGEQLVDNAGDKKRNAGRHVEKQRL